jgi:uncharacterized membrane protein YbaN (DUF454 family)
MGGSTLLRGLGGILAAGFSYVPLVLILVWLLTRSAPLLYSILNKYIKYMY